MLGAPPVKTNPENQNRRVRLGSVFGFLGRVLGLPKLFGAILGHLRTILGYSGAILGLSCGCLGLFGTILRISWDQDLFRTSRPKITVLRLTVLDNFEAILELKIGLFSIF